MCFDVNGPLYENYENNLKHELIKCYACYVFILTLNLQNNFHENFSLTKRLTYTKIAHKDCMVYDILKGGITRM